MKAKEKAMQIIKKCLFSSNMVSLKKSDDRYLINEINEIQCSHAIDIALEEQAKEIFKSVESYIPHNLNKITGWKQVKQKYGVKE